MSNHLLELARTVLKRAETTGCLIATAESCTGGLLASLLTDIEGYSHGFDRGFVVYSNEAKCDLLGVDRGLLRDCGAVSKEVAIAMAKGTAARSCADITIAVTGFAGPGGPGDEEGLVHFAAGHGNGAVEHRVEHYGAIGRDAVRNAAAATALSMMKELLDE